MKSKTAAVAGPLIERAQAQLTEHQRMEVESQPVAIETQDTPELSPLERIEAMLRDMKAGLDRLERRFRHLD